MSLIIHVSLIVFSILSNTIVGSIPVSDTHLQDNQKIDKDQAYTPIKKVFDKIASGKSESTDDTELFELVKKEISETARSIKTPEGTIEAAAQRAQYLVSQLTYAYMKAIIDSKSTPEARSNFFRFQQIVHKIVNYTNSGEFL